MQHQQHRAAAVLLTQRRLCAAPPSSSSSQNLVPAADPAAGAAAAGAAAAAASKQNDEAMLVAELEMLTVTPMPIGTLFKCLSQESRKVLSGLRLPLETYLLRQKDTFGVYRDKESRLIMASRVDKVPITAHRAVEATTATIFNGKRVDKDLADVYTILKFIPNEWSSYVSLGIPETFKKQIMQGLAPKKWMDKYPAFFETRTQSLKSHTFDCRRSLELQQKVAAQSGGGDVSARPPS